MTVLQLLVLVLILCAIVKAQQQPSGYLGCFDNSSLIDAKLMSNNVSYTGETCKAECVLRDHRYAGTKNGQLCFCGDDIQKEKNTTGCDWKCTSKDTEMCGSSLTISIYDTCLCIAGICKNDATCIDLNAHNYSCICSDGWTGKNCDEKVYSSTPHSIEFLSSTSSPLSAARITSTISSTTMTITTGEQPTTQLSWLTGSVDAKTTVFIITYETKTANNTWLLDNLSVTESKNNTAFYISVPVIMLIIVVVGVIIFLIIRRKRQLLKQDSNDIYNRSKGNTLGFSEENNLKHNDHDTIQLEITNCLKDTSKKTMREKGSSALEEISHHYHTIDPPYHSETKIQTEIPVDEEDYEHIKSTTNVVFDPTYSHTTDLQTKRTSEEMYSQVNKVKQKTTPDSNTNQNNEIYDTLNNNATMGKPKPEIQSSQTDNTYNTVSKTGKTILHDDSNNSSSLNEPDYDHVDSNDL